MSKAATDFSVSDDTYENYDDYAELLLGAGTDHKKKISTKGDIAVDKEWKNLTTLDMDGSLNGIDVVHDLNDLPLPFPDESFDEIHAYDVLEHVGQQGDWKAFFDEFAEYWRILKPDGLFVASVPAWDSLWAWGDPGHTRVISEATLVYLNQREYKLQVGKTAMADYRDYWKLNFELLGCNYQDEGFGFVLQKR